MSNASMPNPAATSAAFGTAAQTSPTESLRRGLFTSTAIGLVIGGAFAAPLSMISPWLGVLAFVIIGGAVARRLLHDGYAPKNSVAYGFEGVATSLGDHPTSELLGPGDHFRFPGVEGTIPVDKRLRPLDVPIFDDLAGDDLPVIADEFLYVQNVNSIDVLAVLDADGDIVKQAVAQSRLFINQIDKAENAINLKDDLADYLMLPPRGNDPEGRHAAFKEELRKTGRFTDEGIAAIMEEAGDLVRLALGWGVRIMAARVEKFDLSPAFKEAAAEQAKQEKLMNAVKKRNSTRREMVEELTAKGVDAGDALATVNMDLGLPVKMDVSKKTFALGNFDPNKAITDVVKPITDALAKRISDNSNGNK